MDKTDGYRFYIGDKQDYLCLKDKEEKFTYREFAGLAEGGKKYLENKGIKNCRVILKEKNLLRFMVLMFSLWLNDCWAVPVPWDMKDDELLEVKEQTGTDIVLCWNKDIAYGSQKSERLFLKGGVIHRTSGTTGKRKYCMRKSSCFFEEGHAYTKTFEICHKDRVLVLPPLYHSFAFGAAISAFTAGAMLCVTDHFSPQRAAECLRYTKITVLFLVPAMAGLLCRIMSEACSETKLRCAVAGAGKVTEELNRLFFEKYHVPLLSNYGSTETGGIVSRKDPSVFRSVGRPMDGVRIKVISECGHPAAFGEIGRIMVKSPWMAEKYLEDNCFETDTDGFMAMNDLGFQDADGCIYLCGRLNRMIHVAGEKIDPVEIERTVETHPGVKECAAVEYKGRIKIYISGESGIEEEIRRLCKVELGVGKVPFFIEFMDSLPRNEMGKIAYQKLMEET